jgi:hypothetical protein
MAINSISAHNLQLYQQSEIKRLDKRHEELVVEERRIKFEKEVNEQKRVEMARQLNLSVGQNIDKLV